MKVLIWKQHADTHCAVTPFGTAIVYPSAGGEFYWEVFVGSSGRSRYGIESDAQDAKRRAHRFINELVAARSPAPVNGEAIFPTDLV